MDGIAGNYWNLLEMGENGWKLLAMAGITGNGWTWLEMVGND